MSKYDTLSFSLAMNKTDIDRLCAGTTIDRESFFAAAYMLTAARTEDKEHVCAGVAGGVLATDIDSSAPAIQEITRIAQTEPGPDEDCETAISYTEGGAFLPQPDSSFKLHIHIYSNPPRFMAEYHYLPGVYDAGQIAAMHGHFGRILAGIATSPQQPVSKLDPVTENERRAIEKANDTDHPFPALCIHQVLERRAALLPDAPALSFGDERLSYAELNARINSLARRLSDLGARPGSVVGIMCKRSFELVIAMFAAMKTGAAYVPLSLQFPPEYAGYILNNCGASLLLTNLPEAVPPILPVVDLNDESLYTGEGSNPPSPVSPQDIAAIIYTSGTTGMPKGVKIRHDTVVNYCEFNRRDFSIDENDAIMQFAPFAFSTSIYEIVTTLISGSRLCLVTEETVLDPRMFNLRMAEEKATIILVPPEYAGYIVPTPYLRAIETGASECKPEVSAKIAAKTRHINAYGLTEGSIPCVWKGTDGPRPRRIPIGSPVPNTKLYILNGSGGVCGMYMPGELCVTGMAVAEGYVGLPERQAERFVPNPFGEGVMLRTGDMARWNTDGEIEYIGRKDNQVQIRGMRVELDAVERALNSLEQVESSAVVAKDAEGGSYLAAYVVSAGELDIPALREELAGLIAGYIVPTAIMQIERMPLTPNGKIDKRSLPAMETQGGRQPSTPTEKLLAGLFKQVLGASEVGAEGDFFQLGGHSLRASSLVNRIEEATGIRLNVGDIFDMPTVAQLAAAIDGAKPSGESVQSGSSSGYEPLPNAEPMEYYPMSPAQRGLYAVSTLDEKGIVYNTPVAMKLRGDADIRRLGESFKRLVERHEILRTGFHMLGGEPVLRIYDDVPCEMELGQYDGETEMLQLMREFARPFDLEKPPLIRMKALQGEGECVLLMDVHHIVADGMSMNILLRELGELYNGETLPAQRLQYKDYCLWQTKRDVSAQRDYWLAQFEGSLPVLGLPLDYPRPNRRSFDGETVKAHMDEALRQRIKEVANSHGATEYMVLLSGLMVLLGRLARQEDVVVGSPVSGRVHRDCERMPGMFVNTLAMRGQPAAGKSFETLLAEIKQSSLDAYQNQEYPFEELAEALGAAGDPSRNPVFDVMLVVQNNEEAGVDLRGLELEATETGAVAARFDLAVNISGDGGGYEIAFDYCTALFKRQSMEIMLQHYITLLENLLHRPANDIATAEMMKTVERDTIISTFNDTAVEYPRNSNIVEIFEQQVLARGDNPALEFEGKCMSYAQLNARANHIGGQLRNLGIAPNDIVAVMAERGMDMVAGIIGVLKAGAAYLPIDPALPSRRVRFMLEDSGSKALLGAGGAEDYGIPYIDISRQTDGSPENLAGVNTPGDAAYCIYTSGTTGKPKGVVVEHRSVLNMRQYCMDRLGAGSGQRVLQYANFMFDASVLEMAMALLCGGTLCIAPESMRADAAALGEYIAECGANIGTITPSVLRQLDACGMDIVLSGGEASSQQIALKHSSRSRYINQYGPTEATVLATDWERKGDIPATIPIGRPIHNTSIYMLDGSRLCAIGEPGELCIGGDCLARGYLNQPELTAESFIQNPLGEGRLYRTGDLARWLPDGNIEYMGRIDSQVKIRGHRIEPGEIERQMEDIPGIQQAVVKIHMPGTADAAIHAYYTSDTRMDAATLRGLLAKTLPASMIPSRMMQLDSIPLNRNGKADHSALPEIPATTTEYTAPGNDTGRLVAKVFGEILGCEVGAEDNFFELGGHSLRAARAVNLIEKHTGVRISLGDVFDNPTVEALAAHIEARGQDGYRPIPAAGGMDYYPVTSAQKRLYVINELDDAGIVYNMPAAIRLKGSIDSVRIVTALGELIQRHEILRTSFHIVDGEPVQRLHERVEPMIAFERRDDTSGLRDMVNAFARPFDLSSPPLLRLKVVQGAEDNVLLFDMHHIISDGITLNKIIRDFAAIYGGEKLPAQRIQYKDYALWQQSQDLGAQRSYWLEKLSGELPALDIPLDRPRPQRQSFAGDTVRASMDEGLRSALSTLAASMGATEYMALQAGLMALLARYSGQEDILIGSPVSGRTHPDCEDMAGMFVNTLVMRGHPAKTKSFRQLLAEVKADSMAALENQDYPFELLLDELKPRRDLSRNPLFDVMLVLQNTGREAIRLDGFTVEDSQLSDKSAKFDITMNVSEQGGGYAVELEYSTAIFDRSTIGSMLSRYIALLQSACSDPDEKLGSLPLTSEAETSTLLMDFNDTAQEYDASQTIVSAFERRVDKAPGKAAVTFDGQTLTYAELNTRANHIARRLRAEGIKPDDIVALICNRGLEMIAGILGIQKAGGAYLPIDPALPEARTRFMLEDSGAKAIVTDALLDVKENAQADDGAPLPTSGNKAAPVNRGATAPTSRAAAAAIGGTTLPVIDLREENIFTGECENPSRVNKSTDLAYCIYTSGTTGRPKGVLLEHRGIMNLLNEFAINMGIDENDNVLQFANSMFDASVWEISQALLLGGTLFIPNETQLKDAEQLNAYMRRNAITVATLPPQMAALLDTSRLRLLVTAGSSALREVAERSNSPEQSCTYINAYGPSETSICATYWKHVPGEATPASIPIGKPMCNTSAYVLDGLQLCGIGMPGELCISGDGLARGYLNRPELTSEKFIQNPFGDGRLYRTGDLARWLPDGNIEYLGRIDEQVKIRGYRIELGEIESVLRKQDGVSNAAVVAKGDEIHSYITGEIVDIDAIKAKLATELPEYMLPARMMLLDEIPMNRSGKLDKKALPDIGVAAHEYVAPRDDKEAALAATYAEILGMEKVGIRDSFFELGGDSIKAIRLVSKAREAGWELSMRDIMEQRTVEGVAAIAQPAEDGLREYEQGEVVGDVGLTPIQRQFFQRGYVDEHHFNQALILQNTNGFNEEALRAALEAIAIHHDMLRAVYRRGRQTILAVEDSALYDMQAFDLHGKPVDANWIETQNTTIQSSINLEHGPLLRAALYKTDGGDHLMICIHHLVVDGVSWRILAEDIGSAYAQALQGVDIRLPAKTASFRDWAELLEQYGDVIDESRYWQGVVKDARANDLFVKANDFHDSATEVNGKTNIGFQGYAHAKVRLNEDYTTKLLYETGRAYNTEINDILLCGLAIAVREWRGQESLCIELEGHGREQLHEPLDVDRTVGWFTSLYPVILHTGSDIGESIIDIKEGLRQVPNKGIGYGLLASRGDIEPYTPELCFNYLGHADGENVRADGSGSDANGDINRANIGAANLRQSALPTGQSVSGKNRLPNGITINGSISAGTLELDVSYDTGRWSMQDIQRLCMEYERGLQAVIDHCIGLESGVRTASDFDAAEGVSGAELDALNKLLADIEA